MSESRPVVYLDPREASFREALAADPTDAVTRLVFADWLEERDRPLEAEFQRWCVARKRGTAPSRGVTDLVWVAGEHRYDSRPCWRWWRDLHGGKLSLEDYELPADLFSLLKGWRFSVLTDGRREYDSEAEAWADLERVYLLWRAADAGQ